MRVWDCDPALLTRKHLCGEWLEIHQLWKAVHRRRADEPGGWVNHPETVRFQPTPGWLIGRRHFTQIEGTSRGFNFVAGFTDPDTNHRTFLPDDAHPNVPDPRAFADWDAWAVAAHFPWGPVSNDPPAPEGERFGPWHRDGLTYAEYRTIGPHADGVL